MIRGMTGQASCRFSTDAFDAELEMRSVNSRYFEFRIKTPPAYASLEIDARRIVSKRLARGKIDLSLRINDKCIQSQSVLINTQLAEKYMIESKKLATQLGISSEMSLRELLSLPQVLNVEMKEIEEATLSLILDHIDQLIDQMLPMMHTEGNSTLKDILESIQSIQDAVVIIKKRYPEALTKYKKNLLERVLEITMVKPSEERLAMEVELFAGRTAINEELVRLDNHVMVMKDLLSSNKTEVSKELDFIAQEMNRETNTIASKSQDFEIIEQTIVLKREIEKMREQFRNIV